VATTGFNFGGDLFGALSILTARYARGLSLGFATAVDRRGVAPSRGNCVLTAPRVRSRKESGRSCRLVGLFLLFSLLPRTKTQRRRRTRVDFVKSRAMCVCVCVCVCVDTYYIYKTWAVPAQYGIQFATDSPSGNANNRYWVSLNEPNRSLRKHFCAMGTA